MPYYCKNCGAIVTGKFCSCCGTRVTSDLADFNKELRRRKKAFVSERYHPLGGNLMACRAATFAWEQAEVQMRSFTCNRDEAYSAIPIIEKNAKILFDAITATGACRDIATEFRVVTPSARLELF